MYFFLVPLTLMITLDKIKNEAILEESVHFLEKSGYQNIKADIKGYDKPKSYHKVGSTDHLGPDIEAESRGVKHYFEISVKSEQPQLLKSKWQFLDTLSKMKDYRFKIITRRGHYKFTQDMLDELHLDKHPIHL